MLEEAQQNLKTSTVEVTQSLNKYCKFFSFDTKVYNLQYCVPILVNGCSLSELEECHEPIAKNEEALIQILEMCLNYSVINSIAHFAGMLFMNLANSPTTHCHLAKRVITSGLLKAMNFRKHRYKPLAHFESGHEDATLFG